MIAHARENVPAAAFQVADASKFRVLGKFDGAVCTFDSLNHILERGGLAAPRLQRTAAALKPGAPFAFDMLLESAYQTNWTDAFSLVRDDHVLVLSGSGFDFRTRLAQCRITMFRLLDGVWRRSDVEVHERCYTHERDRRRTEPAGFEGTSCYDARDLGMSGQLGQGRTFVVTTRCYDASEVLKRR